MSQNAFCVYNLLTECYSDGEMTEGKPHQAPAPFIQLLKKAMAEHPEKLSLRQVAQRADLSPAYLSLLLNGERRAPSNDAITRLENVLKIPQGGLNKAAQKPDNAALEFFRKEEAGPIMRTLAEVPNSKLGEVRKIIERFLSRQRSKSK
jgi:transcriptional regulator with XRE-family HTH domain